MSLYLSKRYELAIFISNEYYINNNNWTTFYICYHLENNGRIIEHAYHTRWLKNNETIY